MDRGRLGGVGPPQWTLRSSPETIRAGQLSAMACAEVTVAVAIYWVIAVYWNAHFHLWASIVLAPFLLLRSPQSIALGVSTFKAYFPRGDAELRRPWIAKLGGFVIGAVLAYLCTRYWLVGHQGWSLYWRALVATWLIINAACIFGMAVRSTKLVKAMHMSVLLGTASTFFSLGLIWDFGIGLAIAMVANCLVLQLAFSGPWYFGVGVVCVGLVVGFWLREDWSDDTLPRARLEILS